MNDRLCATFSIAAFDKATKSWGIAVASKHIAIGAYVPYAKAGVGAIATQSFTNLSFGPKGLALLANGMTVKETLDELINSDEHSEIRQVGIVDAKGNAAAFTGNKCVPWAGEIIGNGYSMQGNMLTGENVLYAMEQAYLGNADGFAERLIAALKAGEKAGGDNRGKQAAALLVAKDNTFNDIPTDTFINLRVDDHKDPVSELKRLLELHTKLYLEYQNKK